LLSRNIPIMNLNMLLSDIRLYVTNVCILLFVLRMCNMNKLSVSH